MLNLTSTDLLIIVIYLIITILVGWFAARRINTREDFFMGSRSFGKLLTMFSTFGSGTHADSAVGVASKSYEVGLAGIWYQWSALFTVPIYWLLAPVFRRARVLTTADFFESRYGTEFMVLYSVFGMATCIIFTAVILFGSARLIEALTAGAIAMMVSIVTIGVVAFAYGILGGLIGTVWNDFLQGIMTITMSLMIIPFFWSRIGGLNGLRQALADPQTIFRLVMNQQITPYWIFTVSVTSLLSMVVQPQIMSTAGSARTEMDTRVGFVSGILLKRLMAVPWALTGVIAIALYGMGTIKGDHAFGMVARGLLPHGFCGLMIASVLAGAMSSTSTLMISFSALWTNNIHKRFIKPSSDETEYVFVSRITSAIFGLCSLSLAFAFGDMPSAMRFIWQTVPLMGIAFFLGLFWRRANRYGAFASFFAALAAMLIGQRVLGWSGDEGFPLTATFFVTAGTFCGVFVSYLTPPERAERLDRFYLNINTPVSVNDVMPTSQPTEEEAVHQEVRVRATSDGTLIKLPGFGNWELRSPSMQTWVGFLVSSGIVALMLVGLHLLATWLAGSKPQ